MRRNQAPCTDCGKATQHVHPILGIPVCLPCERNNERYRFVTKTRARREFGLRESDLDRLPHVACRNPHYSCAAPMQLYLLADVRRISVQRPPFDRPKPAQPYMDAAAAFVRGWSKYRR